MEGSEKKERKKILGKVWINNLWRILNKKLIFTTTKDSRFSLFLVEYYVIKTDIIRDYQMVILIVNWITMTRKSGEHLYTTYRNTRQLFQP